MGWLDRAINLSRGMVFALILVFLLVIRIFVPGFYTLENATNILRQAALLGIVSIGQALALLVAGLDLSVSAVIGFTLVLVARLSNSGTPSITSLVLAVFALGIVVGLLNGFLIVKRNVPPFVATLGAAVLIMGVRIAYTGGIPSGQVPDEVRYLALGKLGILPYPFLFWMGLAVLFHVLLRRSKYGRRVYAVGTNLQAAKLLGIRVNRVIMLNYVLCSILAAISGLFLTLHAGYVDPKLGVGFELDSIGAAVIGGVTFAGGEGSIPGVIAGVFFLTVLLNLVLVLGVGPNVQLMVRGGVIVGAVGVVTLRRGRSRLRGVG